MVWCDDCKRFVNLTVHGYCEKCGGNGVGPAESFGYIEAHRETNRSKDGLAEADRGIGS